LNPVLKKSVAHVVRVVMTVAVPALVLTVLHPVAPVVPKAAMRLQPMAATSPQGLPVPMPINPPLSAFAKSPRQLQQLTVKENNYVATRSPEIPQRAKGP
jgi:hypothetical protein